MFDTNSKIENSGSERNKYNWSNHLSRSLEFKVYESLLLVYPMYLTFLLIGQVNE